MVNHDYFLQVGVKGEERLNTLNSLYNRGTQKFILTHGLKPGIRVLEIGGGTGDMSLWLADQVGKKGQVTVIESSLEQIKIIQSKIKKRGIQNIETVHCTSEEINKGFGTFDMVYCRFLLIHLMNPFDTIQRIIEVLKMGGVFVCEDCIFSSSFCYPHLPSFNRRAEIIRQLFQQSHKNEDFGKYLYNIFYQQGFKGIKMGLSQPVLTTAEEKLIIPQFLLESEERIYHHKIASKTEIQFLVNELVTELVQSPKHFVASAQVTQICGVKQSQTPS